jgi:hypothetical protein
MVRTSASGQAGTAGESADRAQAIAQNMLTAYNSGDYQAFSRDWSSPRPSHGLIVPSWSGLGLYGIGNRWFLVGASGQCRRTRIAGDRPSTALTRAAEAHGTGFESHPTATAGPETSLANEAGVARAELHPSVELMPTPPGRMNVFLVGRATSVPFTAVPTGPERTTTDNATQAMTCAVRRLARWRPCPIWLWEQEVALGADSAQ